MLNFNYKGQQLNARTDRPMELDTSFIDEDGFRRNVEKFKWEWIWCKHWAGEAEAGHGWIFTAAMNWLVEALRHAPYLWGHMLYYAGIALVVGLIASA